MNSTWLVRALSWLAAVLAGGFYGVAGTVAHSVMWGPVPIGLIVASVSCLALIVSIRALTRDRAATLAAALGVLGAAILLSGPGPGGSVIIPESVLGVVWLWAIGISAMLVVAWPSTARFATVETRPEGEAEPAAHTSRLDP